MLPAGPVVAIRQAIQQSIAAPPRRCRCASQTHTSGDLGYTQSTVTLQIGGHPAKIVIRDVCVWRREPDGIWRIAHDISNRGEQLHPGEQPYGVTISQG